MGTVLPFKSRARDPSASDPQIGQSIAEIVIFPGVRIERQMVDLSHRVTGPNGKRRKARNASSTSGSKSAPERDRS